MEESNMRELKVYHVDAFTTEKFGGNTAGVVLGAEQLAEAEMQSIARELNLSETVFVLPSGHADADYRVRYFTPAEEIDFCGHATVGLTWLLATEYQLAETKAGVVLQTNIGLIPVVWHTDDGQVTKVEMTQIAPKTRDFPVDLQELAQLAGIAPDRIDPEYPIKLASTGNWHLLIPVKEEKDIDCAAPDMTALANHNRQHHITTTHLYTFRTTAGRDIYTRDFAPGIGIHEDPVTGAANGALAGFLYLEGLIAQDEPTRLTIGQGDAVGRPGTLYVTVIPGEQGPTIKVAGAAVITIRGLLTL